ncbi:MAG: 4Fe-4S cluster-binding domain-containing protein [Bacteroidetes bacterium]|nr:4Fe-4S cluster-binding domain-containing protein [Bacteroidota bacterium]
MDLTPFLDPLEKLHDCDLCPRECTADRFSEDLGYCKSNASFCISSICIHHGEEPAISGEEGICNLFFAHCNLQCIYCQNYQISDNRLAVSSDAMELEEVIRQVSGFLDAGITRVGFVSPSHFIPQVMIIIRCIESLGYKPVWVYNSNGYDKPSTLRLLEGMIDVYLPDLKYMESTLAGEYSDAPDYPEMASMALKEMFRQKGAVLHTGKEGTAESGIIIRHLVLPGHAGNSLKVINFIAEELSPKIHVSLMSQYYPTLMVSCHPVLQNKVSPEEYATVVNEMERLGMENGWIQELSSADHYRPDFEKDQPFGR